MGIGKWIGRPSRAVALVAVGAAGAGAALAVASVPDSSGVIHACVELQNGLPQTIPGNLRLIDSASQKCTTSSPAGGPPPEEALTWNAAGQPGPRGPAGPAGAQGATGNTLTISGESFSLSGGRTATFQSPPALAPFQFTGNTQPIGTMTLNGGTRQATVRHAVNVTGTGALSSEIIDWGFTSQSASTHGAGGGGGAGKTQLGDLHVIKTQDASSPKLMLACATGKHYPKAVLYIRKAGESESLTITLTDVLISSYQSGGHGDQKPLESLSLNFTKIEFQYTKQGKTPANSHPITTILATHLPGA
jgi:type VI secretion system secreted protein Hcp